MLLFKIITIHSYLRYRHSTEVHKQYIRGNQHDHVNKKNINWDIIYHTKGSQNLLMHLESFNILTYYIYIILEIRNVVWCACGLGNGTPWPMFHLVVARCGWLSIPRPPFVAIYKHDMKFVYIQYICSVEVIIAFEFMGGMGGSLRAFLIWCAA